MAFLLYEKRIMKRELNKEEIKFLNFLDQTKKELTERKAKQLKKELLNFKGTYKEVRLLRRKSSVATWLEVKNFLKAKYGLDFFKGLDTAYSVGLRITNFRQKVPDKTLLLFQMFYLKIK